jgi:hypothetical protein
MSVTIDHSTRRNIPKDLLNNDVRTSNLALLPYDFARTNSYAVSIYSYTEHLKTDFILTTHSIWKSGLSSSALQH